MKKLVFFAMPCFVLPGCVSSSATIKESMDAVNNRQADDETRVMNPYEYYDLDNTNKTEIQMDTLLLSIPLPG